jgi:hypothetical protein
MSSTSQGEGWWLASDGKWYPPTSANRPAPPPPPKSKKGAKIGCLVIVGGLVVVILIVVLAVVLGGSSGTTYRAVITDLTPANPAEMNVIITVHNTGKTAGAPDCTIELSSPGSAYTGFDGLTAVAKIRPGGQENYRDTITVTNQGSHFVTLGASSVTCS